MEQTGAGEKIDMCGGKKRQKKKRGNWERDQKEEEIPGRTRRASRRG